MDDIQNDTPNFTPKKSCKCKQLLSILNTLHHPITGETISSYKKLKNDPATAEIWLTVFGKDFGGMCQGDDKTHQKGTKTMLVMDL